MRIQGGSFVSYSYPFHDSVDLHVENRISDSDARRQAATAKAILERLEQRPGLILADEVGMGKTFVALAVAASVALGDSRRRPVVVMVPPSLRDKWPKDFKLFKEKCIKDEAARNRLTAGSAGDAIQFLKKLDDPLSIRKSIIFLTHGAMSPSRRLKDGYVKLAMVQRALHRRHDTDNLRRSLGRYAGRLLRMNYVTAQNSKIWLKLLERDPRSWRNVMERQGIIPPDHDDPVPESVLNAMENVHLGDLYQTLREKMPYRSSDNIESRLQGAREAINGKIVEVWDECIRSLNITLPLLILDEAHHLKNPRTHLASLFQTEEANEDMEEMARGPLAEVFERMLFLTATPFQLGHYELCSVLERFEGVSWGSQRQPSVGRDGFLRELQEIKENLNATQVAAEQLDLEWGKLRPEDLVIDATPTDSVEKWWQEVRSESDKCPAGTAVRERYDLVKSRIQDAEQALGMYLIRHFRPKTINSQQKIPRRISRVGRSIETHETGEHCAGLEIKGECLLPFLLAARVTALRPDDRPVFAEGLASSYDAFLHTRKQRLETRADSTAEHSSDGDDDARVSIDDDQSVNWYLERLQECLPNEKGGQGNQHPKIQATVKRSVELWKSGEKVLVFCHYLATGDALQEAIGSAMTDEINRVAAEKIGCSLGEATDELQKISKRFSSDDSPIRRGSNRAVSKILNEYSTLSQNGDYRERILKTMRRYMRTPSFLTRYFPLESQRMSEELVFDVLQREDASEMSFNRLLRDFFDFLVFRCGEDERERYLDALDRIQPGSAVRLANGKTETDTRQNLMLTFNTPFFPEILVASMIMAEGVDLHLNCRHIIHHDLCWNPSTLEQRTGRIDRIGAKVERCGQPINIYLPYIAQTQDEKMYRVVMDRERWFKVVMGERYKVDARTTEKLAERIPFPDSAAKDLMFNFTVYSENLI
jgi:ERCC4-related helicase